MSTSPSTDGNAERLEQIVSYLDGEMSSAESARVEQQLASDEEFRRELQSIDRAWAALDELPSTLVDDSFLQTTMELVVDSARREVAERTQALPVQRRNYRLTTALLGVGAILLGVLAFRLVWSNPNRLLHADLPVIYQLDVYSQFEQVDYLRMLDQVVDQDDWSLSGEELAAQEEQLQLVSVSESREAWLEGMSGDEQVTLRANFNRFQGLPAAEQVRLRSLHEAIDTAPDSEKLRQTMVRYEHWLNSLSASERYSLQELPARARARRVARILQEKEKEQALNLTPEQLKQFWESLQPEIDTLKKRVLADLSEQEHRRYESEHQRSQSSRGDLRRKFSWLRYATPMQLEEQWLPVVLKSLPEEARTQFERLPPEMQRDRLMGWWFQGLRLRKNNWQAPGRGRSGEALQKELEEFFVEELEPDDKERLLALPHEQMQQQLERMYRGAPTHRGWGEPPEHDRHPPRGFRPPPRREDFPRDHRGGDRPRRDGRRGDKPFGDGGRPRPLVPPPERP